MAFKGWWRTQAGAGVLEREQVARDAWDAAMAYVLSCEECTEAGPHHPGEPAYLEYMCNCPTCTISDDD